jgi:hypothetical protein
MTVKELIEALDRLGPRAQDADVEIAIAEGSDFSPVECVSESLDLENPTANHLVTLWLA